MFWLFFHSNGSGMYNQIQNFIQYPPIFCAYIPLNALFSIERFIHILKSTPFEKNRKIIHTPPSEGICL